MLPLAVLALTGCSTLVPTPLTPQQLGPATQADRLATQQGVDPISGPLTLDEALARALKYNLDRRAKMMEEALAFNQLDVSKFDMLPKLMGQAGYSWRNNDRISQSRNADNGTLSTSNFISQDRSHNLGGLDMTWSMLDVSLGYYGSQQQADRVLIAAEKRRKAMHLLMQDVRTAYWRAAAAQKLRDQVTQTIALAEDALKDSRQTEAERVRNPLDALRYQRQLLENLRLLESINQELSSAHLELANLINAPLAQRLVIADIDAKNADDSVFKIPVATLEEAVLANNADLRETHYNARVARIETRRTLARLFPNVSLNWGVKYDSDSYLVNRDWQEAGVQFSFNLFNLVTGPTQMRLAEAGVALADQRRMAMQLAVLTQMHLARLSLANSKAQFDRADAIFAVDQNIAEMVKNRAAAQTQSKLESVSNATTAILSMLRRYQALAQVQAAESKLIANLGLEPRIGSVGELSLAQLTEQVRRDGSLADVLLPGQARAPQPAAVAAPAIPAPPVAPVAPVTPPAAEMTVAAAAVAPEPRPTPPAESASPSQEAATKTEVLGALQDWAAAWSRRDMKAYAGAYRPDFKGKASSHAAWLQGRTARITPRRRIDVQLSEVTIAVEADLASLSFLQRYQSDNLEVVSVKLIEMEKTDGRWLIRQETEQ